MIFPALTLVAAILTGSIAVRVVFADRPLWGAAAFNLFACIFNAAIFAANVVAA